MKKWTIKFEDDVEYDCVEAETEEEALLTALEWWVERMPMYTIYEEEEEEEEVE